MLGFLLRKLMNIINTELDADLTEDTELTSQIERTLAATETNAKKEAIRRVNKQKREISRLQKHANECLLLGNKEGYLYSVDKLRGIINKRVPRSVLEALYRTSRELVVNKLYGK